MATDCYSAQVFFERLIQWPALRHIIDAIQLDSAFSLVLYGGAVLDLLLTGKVSNDLDFLLQYDGENLGEAKTQFVSTISQAASVVGGKVTTYENDHVVVHDIDGTPTIDIHYPAKSVLTGLFRSEFTVTGIGYDLRKRDFFDPLKGVEDLRAKTLRVHSPAYVISGPSAFPRLYRTSIKLGVSLPEDVASLVRTYAPMVSIHDGLTNMRVLYETLKIFSHPEGELAIRQMVEHGLFHCMFPEATPLYQLMLKKSLIHSFNRNFDILGKSFRALDQSDEVTMYLQSRFGRVPSITQLGVLRFSLLFVGLGLSYYLLQPESPYQEGVSPGDKFGYIARMEKNILGFMVARFREHPDAVQMLASIVYDVRWIGEAILSAYYPRQTRTEKEDEPGYKLRRQIILSWTRL